MERMLGDNYDPPDGTRAPINAVRPAAVYGGRWWPTHAVADRQQRFRECEIISHRRAAFAITT